MAQDKKDNLAQFAKRIASRLRKSSGNTDSMERLICRLLTGYNEQVAARMASEWVEWRFGKAPQPVTGEDGKGPVDINVKIIHVGSSPDRNTASA